MRLRSIAGDLQWSEREFNEMMRRANAAGQTLRDWMVSRLFGDLAQEEENGIENGEPAVAAEAIEIIDIQPAPEPPPVQMIPQKGKRGPRRNYAFDGPTGIDAILDLAERYRVARDEIIVQANGADRGVSYNKLISAWYIANGLGKDTVSQQVRSHLLNASRNLDQIKDWLSTIPDGRLRPDISMGELMYAFENRKFDLSTTPREPTLIKAPRPDDAPAETEEAADEPFATPFVAADSADEPTALIWDVDRRKFVRKPIDEIATVVANTFNDEPEPEPEPTENAGEVGDFSGLALDELGSDQARTLRRFTERLFMQTANPTEYLPQKTLANVISRIKGPNERGETPSTARALIRLGVIKGGSGCYKLMPNFIARLDEVQRWGAAINA